MTEQRAVESPDGCTECGPGNPLAEVHGVHVGMTPVEDEVVFAVRPCSSCNGDRYEAWKTGTLVADWTCNQCDTVNKPGRIVPSGPGMKLECANCGAYSKFLGKRQLGLVTRSTRTRPSLKPSQRMRVFLRAHNRCETCGTASASSALHVGHILSREDGHAQGLDDDLLDSDDNLIAQCEQCNLGLGRLSLPPWLIPALLHARHNQGPEVDEGSQPSTPTSTQPWPRSSSAFGADVEVLDVTDNEPLAGPPGSTAEAPKPKPARVAAVRALERNQFLHAALTYAGGWGIRVFPITPGSKTPRIKGAHPEGDPLRGKCKGECGRDGHGCLDGTTDLDRIRGWWRRWPRANVGISTGPESGVIVVDIDPRHGGFDSLAKLEAEHPDEPPLLTREVTTATGGVHLWFKYPEGEQLGNTAGKLGSGLDTRGAGGFVVAPPSRRPEGTYRWSDGHRRVEDCPKWLIKLLRPEPPAGPPIPARLAEKLNGRPDDACQPVVIAHVRNQGQRYQRQFEGILAFLARQQEGNCSNALFWSACRLREIADRGAPPDWVERARAALHETARRIGIPERDIPKQIASGMKGRYR